MHNADTATCSVLIHASQHCPALRNCDEGFAVIHLQARHFRTTAGRPACMLLQASKVGTPALNDAMACANTIIVVFAWQLRCCSLQSCL